MFLFQRSEGMEWSLSWVKAGTFPNLLQKDSQDVKIYICICILCNVRHVAGGRWQYSLSEKIDVNLPPCRIFDLEIKNSEVEDAYMYSYI